MLAQGLEAFPARTSGVVCQRCHRTVDLRAVRGHDGWQIAHGCVDWEIDVLVLTAGTAPSMWRAGQPTQLCVPGLAGGRLAAGGPLHP